jgi:hypothetical protein
MSAACIKSSEAHADEAVAAAAAAVVVVPVRSGIASAMAVAGAGFGFLAGRSGPVGGSRAILSGFVVLGSLSGLVTITIVEVVGVMAGGFSGKLAAGSAIGGRSKWSAACGCRIAGGGVDGSSEKTKAARAHF